MEIHELWDEPWEGLPPEDSPWEWNLVDEEENGDRHNPADGRHGKLSGDRDPDNGKWFNPHTSSGQARVMAERRLQSAEAAQRTALKRRLKAFYAALNERNWERCFALIDPKLRAEGRVDAAKYAASLARFLEHYGPVQPEFIKLTLYLDATANKHDSRPFAYAVVLWQDKHHEYHLFRERWVRAKKTWYTRVVGLVTHTGERVGA
jgi:hypothetical protein